MRPPNPKYATGKPLKVIQGFHCDGVGYTMTDRGNIRVHGKRKGEQRWAFLTPEEFSDMLWEHMITINMEEE